MPKSSSKRYQSSSSHSPKTDGKKIKQYTSPNKCAVLSQALDERVTLPVPKFLTVDHPNSSSASQVLTPEKTCSIPPNFYLSKGYDYFIFSTAILELT